MLHNISQGKDNQTMKFDQVIEYKKEKYFSLKNIFSFSCRNETGKLVPGILFKKKLYVR